MQTAELVRNARTGTGGQARAAACDRAESGAGRYTRAINDLLNMLQGPHRMREKLALLQTYAGLLAARRLRSSERCYRVLNWKVWSFRALTLRYLFREIFLRETYRFQARVANPVIVDCGANIGMSVLYFKWLYPAAEIHAFEPDPVTFRLLRRNVLGNSLPSVYLYNSAVGAATGQTDFFTDDAEPGSLLMSTDPLRTPKRRLRVPMMALSEFLSHRRIDLLKLDVEGAEADVLANLAGHGTLEQVPDLLIEFHHQVPGHAARLSDFLRILESHGFHYTLAATHPPNVHEYQDVMICARKL
jgi:FkbM family methyltransferase